MLLLFFWRCASTITNSQQQKLHISNNNNNDNNKKINLHRFPLQLQCMTHLSNSLTWNEQNIWTHNSLVPVIATRWLYWGYIWLNASLTQRVTEYQDGWPDIVLLLVTRCLYWGVHLNCICLTLNVKQTLYLTVHVRLTWCSTSPGHQMPVPGGTSDWMSELGMSDCHLSPQLSSWKCQGDLI